MGSLPAAMGRLILLWGAMSLPLVFWPPFEDAFKLPQWLVVWLMTAGVWLGLVGRWREVLCGPLWPVWVLMAGLVVTSAWGEHTRLSDTLWWAGLAATGVALPVACGAACGAGRRISIPALLVSAGALSAFYSVVQFAGFDFTGARTVPGSRPFSTMGNPDFLAAFLVAVLPYAFLRWVAVPGWWRGAAWAVIAGALLLTKSRGAWLGMAAAVAGAPLAILAVGKRVRFSGPGWKALLVACCAAVVFFSFHGQARERLSNIVNIRHFDAAGRLFMWHASAKIIRERPLLGWGPGSYGQVYPYQAAGLLAERKTFPYFYTENAHNDYLQLPAETGLVVSGLLIWICMIFLRRSWTVFRAGNLLGLGAILGLLASQVNAFFNFPWYLLPAQGWLWLMLGSLFVVESPAAEENGQPLRWKTGGPMAGWFLAAGTALVLAGSVLIARDLSANGWLKLSGDFREAGRWRESLACAQRSLHRRGIWENPHRAANNASRAAYSLGDFKAAERYVLLSLEAFPGSPAALSQLGLVLARQGSYAEAEAACREALELNPHQAESYHVLGNLAYLRQDRDGAARFWRRALDEQPGLRGARDSLESLERGQRPPESDRTSR